MTVSKFSTGVNFIDIVGNGKVSNIYAYNCYSTGLMIRASIMTVENMKFGECGATAIELVPTYSNEAGLKQNELQNVTLAGTIDATSNLNDGATNYFDNYVIMGSTIPQVIEGNMQMYSDSQVSHVRNDKKQFIFVSLALKDFSTFANNDSVVSYPAYQAGGIIIVLGLTDDDKDIVANYPCTGMHGGKLILRGDCADVTFPGQISTRAPTDAEHILIRKYVTEYCGLFGADLKEVLRSPFTVVTPDSANPYKQMYVAN